MNNMNTAKQRQTGNVRYTAAERWFAKVCRQKCISLSNLLGSDEHFRLIEWLWMIGSIGDIGCELTLQLQGELDNDWSAFYNYYESIYWDRDFVCREKFFHRSDNVFDALNEPYVFMSRIKGISATAKIYNIELGFDAFKSKFDHFDVSQQA